MLNSHYTSPTIVRAMYAALGRMGFKAGNVLEPACGTGKFFGLVPREMAASKLYGVELDGITGRIAQQLYPRADITADGFENTDFPDEFFDLAIGNVPFGNYRLADRRYAKSNFFIHDYFFAKTLDKVRPGGLITFITSKGTMDKHDNAVRRYIARRADLLGAIRLPNNAFAGAGTEVTADILFLQKRDRLTDAEPDWLFVGDSADSVTVNQYFTLHPEMVLGKMDYVSGPFGQETACLPIPGADLTKQLAQAVDRLDMPNRDTFDVTAPESGGDAEESVPSSIAADPNVRNFSYTEVDGRLYFRENSRMNLKQLPDATARRVRGMMELRDCTRRLIALQMEDAPDEAIQQEQARLNALYDAYSHIHCLRQMRTSATCGAAAPRTAFSPPLRTGRFFTVWMDVALPPRWRIVILGGLICDADIEISRRETRRMPLDKSGSQRGSAKAVRANENGDRTEMKKIRSAAVSAACMAGIIVGFVAIVFASTWVLTTYGPYIVAAVNRFAYAALALYRSLPPVMQTLLLFVFLFIGIFLVLFIGLLKNKKRHGTNERNG